MDAPHLDALRISPRFTSADWYSIDRHSKSGWEQAAKILEDRLNGRFFRYASNCLKSPHSGFVVLSIDSLLLETLQQFREGIIDGTGQSESMVTKFLAGKRFQPAFNEDARKAYYKDIRCGLLHQAEAKQMWLIRRGQDSILRPSLNGEGYVIDVRLFHKALKASMKDYLRDLVRPENDSLRSNLWKKMNHICGVRTARGAMYEVGEGDDGVE